MEGEECCLVADTATRSCIRQVLHAEQSNGNVRIRLTKVLNGVWGEGGGGGTKKDK